MLSGAERESSTVWCCPRQSQGQAWLDTVVCPCLVCVFLPSVCYYCVCYMCMMCMCNVCIKSGYMVVYVMYV